MYLVVESKSKGIKSSNSLSKNISSQFGKAYSSKNRPQKWCILLKEQLISIVVSSSYFLTKVYDLLKEGSRDI